MCLKLHCSVYSKVFENFNYIYRNDHIRMIITDEDSNENANEQIGEITRESFACQNGHYKLTCQVKTPFHLLSRYSAIAVPRGGGGRMPPAPPLATVLYCNNIVLTYCINLKREPKLDY